MAEGQFFALMFTVALWGLINLIVLGSAINRIHKKLDGK